MAPNPFRLEPEPARTVGDSEGEYVVGSAAVYRDEKRPYDYNPSNDTLDTSVASVYQPARAGSSYAPFSRSGYSLARESHAGSSESANGNLHQGVMSPISERDSTILDLAPPAYHANPRTSIGTSFYQQSTR